MCCYFVFIFYYLLLLMRAIFKCWEWKGIYTFITSPVAERKTVFNINVIFVIVFQLSRCNLIDVSYRKVKCVCVHRQSWTTVSNFLLSFFYVLRSLSLSSERTRFLPGVPWPFVFLWISGMLQLTPSESLLPVSKQVLSFHPLLGGEIEVKKKKIGTCKTLVHFCLFCFSEGNIDMWTLRFQSCLWKNCSSL